MLYYINMKFDFGGDHMTKEIIKRIHFLYGIVVSIATAIAGICLMAACYGIYTSGDKPFSREAVAAAFSPIAFPVYLCLILVIIGLLLDFFLPAEAKKIKSPKQTNVILRKLQAKTDLTQCDEQLRSSIEAQRKERKVTHILSIIVKLVAAFVFLSHALDSSNFHQSQINHSMIRAMWVLLPCLIVVFIDALFTVHHCAGSMEKEISLLKQAPAEAKIAPAATTRRDCAKVMTAARCIIIGIAVIILVYGFCAGGTADVLTKAINICTECVGLG